MYSYFTISTQRLPITMYLKLFPFAAWYHNGKPNIFSCCERFPIKKLQPVRFFISERGVTKALKALHCSCGSGILKIATAHVRGDLWVKIWRGYMHCCSCGHFTCPIGYYSVRGYVADLLWSLFVDVMACKSTKKADARLMIGSLTADIRLPRQEAR